MSARVSDAEVEAAAVAMHDRAWAGLFQWDEAEDKARAVYLGAARAALEAAAAVREEEGPGECYCHFGGSPYDGPSDPVVSVDALRQVYEQISAEARARPHESILPRETMKLTKHESTQAGIQIALQVLDAAFPQLKEQSDEH